MSRHLVGLSSTSETHLRHSLHSAARSIRREVRKGNTNEGYQLFTKYSSKQSHAASQIRASQQERFLAHTLLHALHKSQKPFLASNFLKLCLDHGIRIRKPTFDQIFAQVCPASNPTIPKGSKTTSPPVSASLTAAISLLTAAHRSNHQYSAWMFDRVINALLLQGEVLTVALLLATLLKEYNARRNPSIQETSINDPTTSRLTDEVNKSASFPTRAPRPTRQDLSNWMHKVVNVIEGAGEYDIDATRGSEVADRFKALAALVALLEEDLPSVPGRWRIIKAMYSLPYEFFPDKETHERWHSMLVAMCTNAVVSHSLDGQSYNALLGYALRERHSLELGSIVLDALCQLQEPQISTYNTLMRDLVHIKDIESARTISRLVSTVYPQLVASLASSRDRRSISTFPNHHRDRLVGTLKRYPIPRPDVYFTTTSISLAIENGNSQAACALLVSLFPTLGHRMNRKKRIQEGPNVTDRVLAYTPQFWTLAIRASAESKKYGLASRIWDLLAKAETRRVTAVSPFTLQAYTAQFQLLFRGVWSIHKELEVLQSDPRPVDRRRIQDCFKRYNSLLQMTQRLLKYLSIYPTSESWKRRELGWKEKASRKRGAVESLPQYALLGQLAEGGGKRRRKARKEKLNPKIPVDEKLVKIIFSLAQNVRLVEEQLHQLGSDRALHFSNDEDQYRAYRVCKVIRQMFWSYGALAPRQLRKWGWLPATEYIPALPTRRPIPYFMRISGSVRKTRFGFRVVYSGRTNRFPRTTNEKISRTANSRRRKAVLTV